AALHGTPRASRPARGLGRGQGQRDQRAARAPQPRGDRTPDREPCGSGRRSADAYPRDRGGKPALRRGDGRARSRLRRRRREGAFRFRHLLIRDAAYDALPKAMRAELHERFADWLERHGDSLVEVDEILGYHLEQAWRWRKELGAPDTALALRASGRLGAAGR